ncbi:nitroreductase family deazaflavin-dependent oxidoreductase [Gordonia hankookensis]|uniref:Nitroreductase family deazaflavin-dependent oxidoreductase n=1 Tax=Gordonia hankookensis TaxID=589403 RepID=A0ABR7WGY7_9ACTN|nr:nitroreductase family deazaflavin-dependent oxidoreductase [Gordonia hankookensis]MBD1322045.1 nitroreductase family deazaflavin-dependent oxidoreductase [Gordonia hankookensis]NDZ95571.1 nitroreductase family deazaflavin-dependent oxidoreductase [Streptomyces sp. SID11726]NEB26254.1 nitroreductase family deazaflavin-dependent oxidoreductase [Streptomyces sp. SID6673]
MGALTPLAIKIGSISWMPRLLPQIVVVDSAVQRVTGQKYGLLDIGGLPNITLRVAGRRSGVVRSTRLLAVPTEKGWLIAGSYFGGPRMPQWVFNLRAADTAEVGHHGQYETVTWRELDGEERGEAWARMVDVWPNFDLYVSRTERQIPVFLLEPIALI